MEPEPMKELTREEEKAIEKDAEREFAKLSLKDKLNVPGNIKMMVVAVLSLDVLIAIACLLLGDWNSFGMVMLSTVAFSWLGWFFFGMSIRKSIYFQKKLQYLEKKAKE